MAVSRHTRGDRFRRGAGAGMFLLAGLLSTGCLVLSLQPIYDEHTIEFDETLLGTWVDPAGGATVTFDQGAWNAYRVTLRERAKASVFTAYRTRIGGATFLDLSPEAGVETAALLIPAHMIVRIKTSATQIKSRSLDYDWFMDASEARRLGPLSFAIDGKHNVVLTSATRALRDWLAAHLDQAETFADEVALTKTTVKSIDCPR